jgi:ABC-type multidrug transport system fused ATPase/permease subunit
MFYEPVRQLVSINNLVSAGKASGERVFEILDADIQIRNPARATPFPSADHSISFQSVSFSYDTRASIVANLDFRLQHGSTTALVGPTGAGKSTVANLILRYYDVEQGSVRIGNVDVRDLRLKNLRSQIGFVSQDPFLFDASVKENLLLAEPSALESDLQNALKVAHAWNFVNELPDGWDTLIGERGVRLSMGEKQRLTLARAILKAPPIVILDEATSSVDVETERGIQNALATLTKDRTTLVIAHRLSTIRDADQILFLEKGKIIEQGKHEELVDLGGAYARFCKYQENFIPEKTF